MKYDPRCNKGPVSAELGSACRSARRRRVFGDGRCPGRSAVWLSEAVCPGTGWRRIRGAGDQGLRPRASRSRADPAGPARDTALGIGHSDSADRYGPGQDAPVDQRGRAPKGLGRGAPPRSEPGGRSSSSGRIKRLGTQNVGMPSRYGQLDQVALAMGLTPGALKARFRRRDLPSPFAYTTRLRARVRQ